MPDPGGRRPTATVSLDLDDAWAYLRTHGDGQWARAPSVLGRATDRLLPLLDELGLRITVFVVGRDARLPEGRRAIRAFSDAGHEIANHSLEHRSDLALLPPVEIVRDLQQAADAIAEVTGQRPLGFRCPSYGISLPLVRVLLEQGYRYDASLLPSSFSSLARLYHRASMARTARRESAQGGLFGPAANALLPLTPFRWTTPDGDLLELPVTTCPLLRTPMHMSYLQAIGAHSAAVADAYLGSGLRLCRMRRIPVSFLLHPTDVLDTADAPSLGYFPGMSRPWDVKLRQVRRCLGLLTRDFHVVPLGEAAERLRDDRLPRRTPRRAGA